MSNTCLLTISPISRLIVSWLFSRIVILILPFFLWILLAPGHLSGPFSTNLVNLSILKVFTVSGLVKLVAILMGTPSWSNSKLGSGVITLLAEKSTLLPIRLLRIRPSLPFNLWRIAFKGLPERWVACEILGNSLSTNVATWYCNIFVQFLIISGATSLAIFCLRLSLNLMISDNLWVKSSSILCELSCLTDGLTAGGGTGKTEQINHSGLHHASLKPMKLESSSVIFSKICLIYSAS